MGETTDDVPKALLEVEGRTLYERQRMALSRVVDGITVVLGYEAETARERLSSVESRLNSRGASRRESRDGSRSGGSGGRSRGGSGGRNRDGSGEQFLSVDTVILDDWDEYDNAESLRRALVRIEDDALVLNGDVVVTPWTVERLVRRFHEAGPGQNVVGCLPGVQDDHTAIRWDDAGEVTAYGEIAGHRHAGIGVIDHRNRDAATDLLARNADDWYPHLYPETPTRRVLTSPDAHLEINRREDLATARERLPLADAERLPLADA